MLLAGSESTILFVMRQAYSICMVPRDSSGEVWIEWLTSDDGFEGGEQRHPLLSEGGEIPAQARERVSAPI